MTYEREYGKRNYVASMLHVYPAHPIESAEKFETATIHTRVKLYNILTVSYSYSRDIFFYRKRA